MKASHFSPDIQEFLFLLWAHKAKYVIVGGEAVIYHGFARLTGDIDFFYEPTAQNIQRLYRVLKDFWQGSIPGVKSAQELAVKGVIIQFGVPPNRIDLINSITGVSFKDAWKSRIREQVKINDQLCSIFYIGINQLLKNKEAINRPKDQEDLKYLRAASEKHKS